MINPNRAVSEHWSISIKMDREPGYKERRKEMRAKLKELGFDLGKEARYPTQAEANARAASLTEQTGVEIAAYKSAPL
jgi:hypothetical protein